MDFVSAVKAGLGKYATFSGRARRSEYWWFILFYEVVLGLALVIDFTILDSMPVLNVVVSLGLLLPSLGVSIRRLHDIDRSGWWFFVSLVPVVGIIILIVWLCKKGADGANRFGDDPLSSAASA